MADLTDQLARHADELAAHHEKRTSELGAACGLPSHQREVDAEHAEGRAGNRRPADPGDAGPDDQGTT